MITKRLLIALAVVAVGLGGVFLIPNNPRPQQAGVVMKLPPFVGLEWVGGDDLPATEKERQILAADTGFARRTYTNGRGDRIYLGLVLSGEDMANSIHRPERCLPAQGVMLQSSDRRRVELPDGSPLEMTRLHCMRPLTTTDNKQVFVRDLTYYWFVGTHDRTASHWTRTFYDIRDRLLHGENQRWAYVTVEALVTENLNGPFAQRSEEETTQMIEDFIRQAVPSFQHPPASS